MSEEEIKILKILINNKDVFYYEDDFNNKIRPLVGKLLDLYNKEKETSHYNQSQLDIVNAKIIELQKELEQEKEKNKELDEKFRYAVPDDMIDELYVRKELYEQLKEENQIQRKQLNDAFDRGWIHKDKIKEKIEEIHKEPMNYNPDEYWIENECKGYAIDILKELLEV